ncbi:hypothetical protein Scep_021990 [Stephania cephalantha]|uniref:Uncharacterized protein n=1 Tax=Stephania cephalantha TaxID=152367 RepID=A0AAP0F5J6_9MAGN
MEVVTRGHDFQAALNQTLVPVCFSSPSPLLTEICDPTVRARVPASLPASLPPCRRPCQGAASTVPRAGVVDCLSLPPPSPPAFLPLSLPPRREVASPPSLPPFRRPCLPAAVPASLPPPSLLPAALPPAVPASLRPCPTVAVVRRRALAVPSPITTQFPAGLWDPHTSFGGVPDTFGPGGPAVAPPVRAFSGERVNT